MTSPSSIGPGTSAELTARELADRADLSARVARAVSGRSGLQRQSRGWWQDGDPLRARAPHVHPELSSTWASVRGAGDAISLLARYSDRAQRAADTPADDVLAELVFSLLEQLRVEALGLLHLGPGRPGLARNLQHRFDGWTTEAIGAGVLENEQGQLVFTIAHATRSRLTGLPLTDELSDLMEVTRARLAPHIGTHLHALRRTREDQAAYAVHAVAIARTVSDLVATERRLRGVTETETEEESSTRAALALLVGFDGDLTAPETVPLRLGRRESGDSERYRVFTTAYDRCSEASSLVPQVEREVLHDQLVELARDAGPGVGRLAARMSDALTTPVTSGYDEDMDEGLLDPRKLPQVVTTPLTTAAFRTPASTRGRRTAVSVLVDCSGSMKAHRARIAPLLLGWARAAARAGIPGEVLGHTTRSWNGGAAERAWRRSGRPAGPGRLAELQLLVLSDGTTRPRPEDFAPLLRTVLYRESVTGEATAWALDRLRDLDADRRILLIITDGAPGEAATTRTNGPAYLDDHLDRLLAGTRARGDVEVVGAGVDTDIAALCDRHLVLELDEPLDHLARDLLRVVAHP